VGSSRDTVAIIGGDPVTARSLEALLLAAGYHVRSLAADGVDEIEEALAGSRLLIVAPSPGPRFRRVLPRALSRQPLAGIPVLELLPVDGGRIFRGEYVLAWPCSPARIKRAIETALHSRG
jgi:hypothetical protein